MGAGDVTLPGGANITADNFGKMGPKIRKFNRGGFGPNKKGRKGGFKMQPYNMKQIQKMFKGMKGGNQMMMMPMGGMMGMPMMMNPMMMGGGMPMMMMGG